MIDVKEGLRAEMDHLLRFRAQTVTSSKSMEVGFDRGLPAGQVARTLARMMVLPDTVDWQLRLDSNAAFLSEDEEIGAQIEPGAQVSISPRVHLGGGSAPSGAQCG